MFPIGSVMATIVLLHVAAIEATPCGTFFRSLRLVPARRAPAFGALAVAMLILRFAQRLRASGLELPESDAKYADPGRPKPDARGHYFLVAFFLPATAPLRGPLRVRA